MLWNSVTLLKKLPPPLAREAKRALVYPRYWVCRGRARRAAKRYAGRYRHAAIFIAGMPKSGTTWLEKMLASYPGYQEVLPPEANVHELKHGESHRFELPEGCLERLTGLLAIVKMHIPGSERNVGELAAAGIPYAILYRDLRDVAVSHYHYVRNTPWHGDYKELSRLGLREGVRFFVRRRLPEFCHWMNAWADNRDPDNSVMFAYEDMLDDPAACLRRVLDLYELPADDAAVQRIVEANSFAALSGGREAGSADDRSFFRSGRAGGWRDVFDAELEDEFRGVAGETLKRFGYE